MPRKPSLLHVRSALEWVERSITEILHDNGKDYVGGINLPPAYETDLRQQRLIIRAILKKHKEKGTRKDLFLEK
jgi:hypothetical protein